MNKYERKMCELLRTGREQHGVVATKAEFEAEGTRTDELLRLLEIAHRAGVAIALKVGGCEAIRDLLEAKQFGVRYIIAPMVETPYALSKYIQAKTKVFSDEEDCEVDFLFNLETITAYNHLDEMIAIASDSPGCHGMVFGRVDFAGSLGLDRQGIESKAVTNRAEKAAAACKAAGLDFVVGGAVSIDAVDNLKRLNNIHLSRFETRKVVFDADALNRDMLESALKDAVHFELLWLLNKRDYYGFIHREDESRIAMLEARWHVLDQE
ncbi:MAG: aldolase/citrate lyase family protein [Cyanobium sp.]